MRSVSTTAPADVETALAEVVAQLRRAMRRAARSVEPTNTLAVAQLELLACLAENPGARPSQLAKLLRLAPNSITTIVNGLSARGYVTRNGCNGDRRTVALQLTATGRKEVRSWQETSERLLRGAWAGLHPAWQQLLAASVPALQELVIAIDDLTESRVSAG